MQRELKERAGKVTSQGQGRGFSIIDRQRLCLSHSARSGQSCLQPEVTTRWLQVFWTHEIRIYWSQGQNICTPLTHSFGMLCVGLMLPSAASALQGRDGTLHTAISASDMLVLGRMFPSLVVGGGSTALAQALKAIQNTLMTHSVRSKCPAIGRFRPVTP